VRELDFSASNDWRKTAQLTLIGTKKLLISLFNRKTADDAVNAERAADGK